MTVNYSSLCVDDELDEFLPNPTPLSRHLRDIIRQLHGACILPCSQNFFKRTFFLIRLLCYLKLDNSAIFNDVKEANLRLSQPDLVLTLESLIAEFTLIQKKLIFNNIALSYFYTQNVNKVETRIVQAPYLLEEESKILLRDLAEGKVTVTNYIQKFGHFSLNNYELAEKRFSEYSESKLKRIGNLMLKTSTRRLSVFSGYFKQFCNNPVDDQEIYGNLLLIRDLSKYVSVKIIALLRRRIVILSEKEKVMNPFTYEWDELISILENTR